MSAFFRRDGERLLPSPRTSGPWSAAHQHGGPPAALLVRAVERQLAPRETFWQLTRATIEFLRPVPLAPLEITHSPVRQGRAVETWRASLYAAGKEVAHALILAQRVSEGLPAVTHGGPLLPGPEESAPFRFPFSWDRESYADGIEVRWARGTFGQGDGAAWMRAISPLVEGEATSPAQQVALLVDAANGVSAPLPYDGFTHVNPDLTLALARPLEGPWLLVDSCTTVVPGGLGLVDARLADARGYLGRSLQSLVVRAREPEDS